MIANTVRALQAWLEGRGAKPIGVWVLALGACMTLGFAPFGLWPVAMLSLAGLYWLVRHAQSRKQAMGAALVWGMGHQITALYWLPWAFFKDAGGSWMAAIGGGVPAVLGLALFGSVAFMLVSLVAWSTARKAGWRWGGVAFVVTWVLIEFVKGLHPMGFPWLPVGAVFAMSSAMIQGAAMGGVWLLSGLLLTMAVLVSSGTRRSLTLAAAIAVVMWTGGFLRLLDRTSHSDLLTSPEWIRVVQPNIQSAHKWDARKRWDFLQETLAVGLAGDPSQTTPRTVIMPETAVAFYLDEEDDVRRAVAERIAARMPESGALVTGTVRREVDDKGERYFNTLGVMDTKGNLRGAYDKRLLVPFGEYIPGRKWLERLPLPVAIRTISQSRIDFTHGTRYPLLATPAGLAVGLICYEGIFPLQVAKAAKEARYLINVTNDGWFTGTIALYQHAALTRLRAVETGLPMVRVANTGITVVYDGYGQEMIKLPINTATYGDLELPEPLPETPFVQLLDWLAL